MIKIDKIPIEIMVQDPITDKYKLGTVEISKGEYANSEKINEIIEALIDIEKRLVLLENK